MWHSLNWSRWQISIHMKFYAKILLQAHPKILAIKDYNNCVWEKLNLNYTLIRNYTIGVFFGNHFDDW